jgi:hypothetical protein
MVKIKVFVSFNLTACSVEGQQKSLIEDVVGLTDEVDGIHILRGALESIGVGHPSPVVRVGGGVQNWLPPEKITPEMAPPGNGCSPVIGRCVSGQVPIWQCQWDSDGVRSRRCIGLG